VLLRCRPSDMDKHGSVGWFGRDLEAVGVDPVGDHQVAVISLPRGGERERGTGNTGDGRGTAAQYHAQHASLEPSPERVGPAVAEGEKPLLDLGGRDAAAQVERDGLRAAPVEAADDVYDGYRHSLFLADGTCRSHSASCGSSADCS